MIVYMLMALVLIPLVFFVFAGRDVWRKRRQRRGFHNRPHEWWGQR